MLGRMLKRLTDITVALVALVLLSPLMLILAGTIRFSSAGPVIFRQTRVGRYSKHFTLFKFRTMGLEEVGGGLSITASNDPRITPLGGVLRRWKLDELPQFWNVFCGDMSLVGPRPEVAQYVELWPADARSEILSLRPGLIDLAFVELPSEEQALSLAKDPETFYRNELLPKKIAIYLSYVRTRSWIGDLVIICRSINVILKRGYKVG